MPRRSRIEDKRQELLPVVTRTFAELGFRRATTAELAGRCGVQETILYRLWPDKRAMFIAAIGHVYQTSASIWRRLLKESGDGRAPAERLLAYESEHHGEFGYYRIIFAGLSETDDPAIRAALADMYRRYQRFVRREIAAYRRRRGAAEPDAGLSAWAVVGLGTVASIARELGLIRDASRQRLFKDVGRLVLEGQAPAERGYRS